MKGSFSEVELDRVLRVGLAKAHERLAEVGPHPRARERAERPLDGRRGLAPPMVAQDRPFPFLIRAWSHRPSPSEVSNPKATESWSPGLSGSGAGGVEAPGVLPTPEARPQP